MHSLFHSLLSLTVTAAVAAAQQAPFVSPASRVDREGDTSTTYPLGRFDHRLQQIHADLPAALTTISGHGYRRDATNLRGVAVGFQTELEVQLSVAATPADAPSRTFAQNRGASVATVLPRSVLSFPTTDRPAVDPAPAFEFVIPYATPWPRPAGSVVCVEVIVHGNQTASGADRNFTPYLDAHDLTRDGSSRQPGFQFGTGCRGPSQSNDHTAQFEFLRTPLDLELQVVSRYGAPTVNAGSPATTTLLFGATADASPWAFLPSCTLWTGVHAVVLGSGANDQNGHWSGTLTGLRNLPDGLRFYAQAISGDLANAEMTFSEGSILTVPGLEPTPIQVSRIASGSDRNAATGTTSFGVPVTWFY